MCKAAIACGADGLIIEVHEDPEHAISDAAQTITPDTFAKLIADCRRIADAVDRAL
jgi:3-deoxy-7-phosphoheptulonate synthase